MSRCQTHLKSLSPVLHRLVSSTYEALTQTQHRTQHGHVETGSNLRK